MEMRAVAVVAAIILGTAAALSARAQECDGDTLCPDCLCCSRWGFCGSTDAYCGSGSGCQSQCGGCGGEGEGGVASIISESLFDQMLPHRNDRACPARGLYTYEAFVEAADAFPTFGTTGDADTRKRELAAFMAQTSHETMGGWHGAPGGPYAWGYCFKEETEMDHHHHRPSDYCRPSTQWPCVPGKEYYGRGPLLLSWNYNYGPAARDLGLDLLDEPELVSHDSVVSFKSAIWSWMDPQQSATNEIEPQPSCHDVMTGQWIPSAADLDAGRLPGYGATTNIINGEVECGHGRDGRGRDRIGFFKRYCDMLNVSYGHNLDCYYQKPFAFDKSSSLSKADA